MLSAETDWGVGLLADRVVITPAPHRTWRRGPSAEADILRCDAAEPQQPRWEPAVKALLQRLRQDRPARLRVKVRLSSEFVRWLVLPWPAGIDSMNELYAMAQLQFREVFGPVAQDWRLSLAPVGAGQPLLVCAVDQALIDAFQSPQLVADGVRVQSVEPYFSAAFDRWLGRVGRQTSWFLAVEPQLVTMGLWLGGACCGVRCVRIGEGDEAQQWQQIQHAQSQMGLSLGSAVAPDAHAFVTGWERRARPDQLPHAVWLGPSDGPHGQNGLARMASGL